MFQFLKFSLINFLINYLIQSNLIIYFYNNNINIIVLILSQSFLLKNTKHWLDIVFNLSQKHSSSSPVEH